MQTQNSDFGAAVSVRNRYAHEVEDIESEISKLETKLSQAKYRLEVAEDIVKEIQGTKPDKTPPLKGFGKYSSMQIGDAILDVLNTREHNEGLSALDIMRHLVAGGFSYKGKSFYATAYSVSQYLVKTGKASEMKHNGKRVFVKKQK